MKTNILITNSELARITELPISKVRRNTKEFLPPDPQATRRSGYSRKLNLDDAFKVFIGTHLVSCRAYSFPEARTIIADIWPWLETVALLPGKTTPRKGIDKEVTNYMVRIRNDDQYSGFHYSVRGDIESDKTTLDDPVRGRVQVISKQTYIYEFTSKDSHAIGSPSITEPHTGAELILRDAVYVQVTRVLHISDLASSFMTAIDKL